MTKSNKSFNKIIKRVDMLKSFHIVDNPKLRLEGLKTRYQSSFMDTNTNNTNTLDSGSSRIPTLYA